MNVMHLLNIFVNIVIWGGILYLLWWGLTTVVTKEPFFTIGKGVLVLATVIILIGLIFGIGGIPTVRVFA